MKASITRRYVLGGVMLLAGLGLAACGQPKEVVVPVVTEKDAAAARSELTQLGLKVLESAQVTTGKTLGLVIDQDPKAGSKLAEGGTVTLMVAAGQATLTVPNVVRLPFDQARQQLEAARLQVKRKDELLATLEFRDEEVVSQRPAALSPAATGAVVELEVAGPSVAVPDVSGKGLQDAIDMLTAQDFLVSVGGDQRDPRRLVGSTTPPASSVVLEGTHVLLNLEMPQYFFIRAKDGNKCFNQTSASHRDWDGITQWDCVNQPNLKLEKVPAADGLFYLKFAHSGKCVTSGGAHVRSGSVITQSECIDQPNLKWREEPAGDGYVYLRSAGSNKCIAEWDPKLPNGGPIVESDCNRPAEYQYPQYQWKFEVAP